MPTEFKLVKTFLGYKTKEDESKLEPGYLVEGSQNVLINDAMNVEIRGGYTVFGAESEETDNIESSFKWETSSDSTIHLRAFDDKIQIYTSGLAAWTDLYDSFSAVDFCFDTWWDTSEGIDVLLFVNGTDSLWEWSGGIATIGATTSNTITKTGTETWAEARFLTAGTRKVIINGTEYTYTGGESTTTLTGVTPDPSGEADGSTVLQVPREYTDTPSADYNNDIIRVLENHLYVGSNSSKEAYISANDDYTDFTYSSPRVPGEGTLLTLDNVSRALAHLGELMVISAGRDSWYKVKMEQLDVGGTLVETVAVEKIKTSGEMGAQSQDLVCEIGDYLAFISFEPELRLLQDIKELEGYQITSISDPIKPDIEDANFTGGHLLKFRNRLYLSAPSDGEIFINEIRQYTNEAGEISLMRFWQPPQILPIQRFTVISGEIYGHSHLSPETYKLFDGKNDNDVSFEAIAEFSYMAFGERDKLKVFDEWITEGYISSNTDIELTLNYGYGGAIQQLQGTIEGGNSDILLEPVVTGSLGDESLGVSGLGVSGETEIENPKFRTIQEFPAQDFHLVQAQYRTDVKDAEWSLLCFGPNAKLSPHKAISIKT